MAYFQPTFAAAGVGVVANLQSDPFIQGLQVFYTGATLLTILPGSCRAYNNDSVAEVLNPIVVDTTQIFTQANPVGCAPFSPAVAAPTNDTSFGLYLVWDNTGTLAAQNPAGRAPGVVVATGNGFMPVGSQYGYNSWRRIATIPFSAGTNNVKRFLQSGSGVKREMTLSDGIVALAGGAATSLTQINLSGGNLPLSPYFSTQVKGTVLFIPASAGDSVGFSSLNTSAIISYPVEIQNSAAAASQSSIVIAPNAAIVSSVLSSVLYYVNSAAAGATTLNVTGWTEDFLLQAL